MFFLRIYFINRGYNIKSRYDEERDIDEKSMNGSLKLRVAFVGPLFGCSDFLQVPLQHRLSSSMAKQRLGISIMGIVVKREINLTCFKMCRFKNSKSCPIY